MRSVLQKAERDGFKFGAKLVRGAYMVQERQRAADMGYEDPIHRTKPDTDACYEECWSMVLDSMTHDSGAELMIASHNEKSVRAVTQRMAQLGIAPSSASHGESPFPALRSHCLSPQYFLVDLSY